MSTVGDTAKLLESIPWDCSIDTLQKMSIAVSLKRIADVLSRPSGCISDELEEHLIKDHRDTFSALHRIANAMEENLKVTRELRDITKKAAENE